MKVKFTQDAELRNAANELVFEAKSGDVMDLKDDAADRWIKRGKAEMVDKENPAQQYMAEGAKAPAPTGRRARSPDDEAAEKKTNDAAKAAADAEKASAKPAEVRRPGGDTDMANRPAPDALKSSDIAGKQ